MPDRKYFIFVTSGFRDRQRAISGRELVSNRLGEKRWPLGPSTRNKDALREGDLVLMYVARLHGRAGDKDAKCFVAQAEVAGGQVTGAFRESREWTGSVGTSSAYVPLRNPSFFRGPIPIEPLVPVLSFVQNKRRWGVYLQGGILSISRADFELILESRSS